MQATSIASYRKHNYSGPRKSRKRVLAQLMRHGKAISRKEAWRKKPELDLPSTSEEPLVTPADTVCRVCLVKQLELLPVTNDLQNVYETVTREEYNKPGYPVCMCYICLAELRKCLRFVETARDSNRVLEQWYTQPNEIRMVHPFGTYVITQVEIVSYGYEEILLDQDVKPEVDDLQELLNWNTNYTTRLLDRLHSPNDKNDTLQDDNERQQEAELSSLDQAPGTSGGTGTKNIRTETETTFLKNDCSLKETENISNKTKSNITSNAYDEGVHLIKQCLFCNFKCVTDNDLTRHMLFHDKSRRHVCDVCQYRFDKVFRLKKHKAMHDIVFKNGVFCDICGFKGVNKLDLRNHKKIHIGEKIFSCDVCDYKCVNRGRLNEHEKTHTGVKPHSCHICSFKTTAAYTLANHLKIHTGEKPFTCNICDHKVRTKARLTEHMKIHNGEKFTCDICDFKSITKSRIKNHIRRHTDEKPFLCDICSHAFTYKASLQKHVMSKHTDEKPFSCNECSYKTARKDNLITHMRTHTGEKPFSCGMCGYKYSHRVSLKQHLLTKHKIKKVDTTKTGSS